MSLPFALEASALLLGSILTPLLLYELLNQARRLASILCG